MAKKIQHDSETRKELLKCAKEEFMDKGFMGASLRNICHKAGVICTLFTGQPVRRVFLCVIVMSLK